MSFYVVLIRVYWVPCVVRLTPANVHVSVSDTALEPDSVVAESDAVLYADVEFSADRPAAPSGDESVIYTRIG